MSDEILDEVRRARLAYGERFGFDPHAIGRDLREQERLSGREIVRLSPKRVDPAEYTRVVRRPEPRLLSDEAEAVASGS